MTKKVFVSIDSGTWKGYTGPLGSYYFENGVSKDAIPLRAALRIGSSMEAYDQDGVRLHPTSYPLNQNPGSISVDVPTLETEGAKPAPVYEAVTTFSTAKQIDLSPTQEVGEDGRIKSTYSRNQLEAIADQKGINGLRDIGDPLNVKGRSVTELIDKIIEAQA